MCVSSDLFQIMVGGGVICVHVWIDQLFSQEGYCKGTEPAWGQGTWLLSLGQVLPSPNSGFPLVR